MLPSPRRQCCVSLANSLATWTRDNAGGSKATFADATPSGELTPSDHLAAVSRHLSWCALRYPDTRPSSRLADDPR
jgi:hypothetical protein